MTIDPFQDFDPSNYQRVSNLSLQSMISLAKALDGVRPDEAPAHVDKLAGRMKDATIEAEDAMIIRLREDNHASRAPDLELDNAVDPLWSLFARRLDDWTLYTRPGLDFLDDDPDSPPEVDIVELRDKADRAARLSAHLFGQSGLAFVQRPYTEQVQLMANVLGLIDADELEDELIELTGPELLPLLRRAQLEYEAMVQARVSRPAGSAADLRALRGRLRRVITRYAGAVMTMLDEDEPETLAVVEAALAPMVSLRATVRSSDADVEVAEDGGEVGDEEPGLDDEGGTEEPDEDMEVQE